MFALGLVVGAALLSGGAVAGWIARERLPKRVRMVDDPYSGYRDPQSGLYSRRATGSAKGGR